MKANVHNEWFQPLVKTTCDCGKKNTKVYSWGEYHRTRWSVIAHFCKACYSIEVKPRLKAHGRRLSVHYNAPIAFSMNARSGHTIPNWIRDGWKRPIQASWVGRIPRHIE